MRRRRPRFTITALSEVGAENDEPDLPMPGSPGVDCDRSYLRHFAGRGAFFAGRTCEHGRPLALCGAGDRSVSDGNRTHRSERRAEIAHGSILARTHSTP